MSKEETASKFQSRYCVVVPAFEAAATIGDLVKRVRQQGLTVLVVDDGSKDRTGSIASEQGALVLSHLKNRGKGNALRTAFNYALRAQFDGVITMDSDGQHLPEEIPKLIQAGERQHAAIVLGNRMDQAQAMPSLRRQTNHLMSALISRVIRQKVPDSQCGFRIIRKEVLAALTLRAERFEIESEVLLGAAKQKWKIISVPVTTVYRPDERSHIRPLRDAARFMGILFKHAVQPCR